MFHPPLADPGVPLSAIPLSMETLFESSPDCAKVLDAEGKLQSMNVNGRCAMEIDDFSQVHGLPWPTLWPETERPQLIAAMAQARNGQSAQFVAFCPTAKGTPKWWEVRVDPIFDDCGDLQGFLAVSRDVTTLRNLIEERRQSELFSDGQKRALEQAVAGAPLADVLATLVKTAEACSHGSMLASVLLLDESGQRLHVGAAPSLPAAYNDAIHGMAIGPSAGSCGTAAFRGTSVFVRDTATDPLWAEFRDLAGSHGLAACWSHPVLSSDGKVLATFAFYYREIRDPSDLERQAMPVLVHTAALVLERHREAHQRQVAQRALLDARMRLEATLAAGEVATWVYDIRTGRVSGDRNFERLFDIPAGQADSAYEDLCRRAIHPDDIELVNALVQHAITTGKPFEATYRLQVGGGTYRHVIARGRVQYGDDGAPTMLPGVLLDITAQKQAEEGVRRFAAQLSQVNRRKTQFLATLAHELRNPLAPIRNGLEVLRLAGSDPAAAAKVRAMMSRQVDHMVHLIDDLLDVARIDSGKIDLKMEALDINAIVANAVEASGPYIDAAQHRLTLSLPAEPLMVRADATRLSQVLINVLGNAAKYTPERGEIALAARREGREVVISVSDTGIGIPQEALGSIFDMFAQVERSRERSQRGLGIGLSLVSSLVRMHGGEVSAHSAGEGHGSTFTIRLPLLDETMAAPAQAQPATGALTRSSARLDIMVVDDNADAADSMAAVLRMRHHSVTVAHDGHDALRLIGSSFPDVVFLDIGMPGLDGYALAAMVRKMPGMERITLVALTGWGAEHDRARATAAGFDHHLTKPAPMKALDDVLARVAGQAL